MLLRRLLLSSLVLTCFIAACEHRVTAYPSQPAMTQGPVASPASTRITVHFVRDVDEILVVCPDLRGGTYYGCAKPGQGTCDVYLQQPTDFNDEPRLATMGHELFHCMGAKHG